MAIINAITDTWNNAGTVFTAIKMTVTNTASAPGSKLIDLLVGASSKFSVDKDGAVAMAGPLQNNSSGLSGSGVDANGYVGAVYYNGTNLTALTASPSYIRFSAQSMDVFLNSGGVPNGATGITGTNQLSFSKSTGTTLNVVTGMNSSYFGMQSGAALKWSSTGNWYQTADLGLSRNAAGVLEINNGTAGTLRDIKVRTYLADATITAGGTTGAQTINKSLGTVNFAAGATSLVVTNSIVTTSSIIFCTIRTNDSTAAIKNVVPTAGSFTINLNAAATAETSVGFIVHNG